MLSHYRSGLTRDLTIAKGAAHLVPGGRVTSLTLTLTLTLTLSLSLTLTLSLTAHLVYRAER